MVKPDGSAYAEGDVLRQPALAATLRAVAQNGTDYMYNGPWAERAVAAIQAEGGKMTLEDLASYEVRWDTPLVAPLGEYETPQQSAAERRWRRHDRGLQPGHWRRAWWRTATGRSPRTRCARRLDVTQMMYIDFLPAEMLEQFFPGVEITAASRVTPEYATEMWARMEAARSSRSGLRKDRSIPTMSS